jgi:decaprenyl-phosphate phosphoribosyltransferase
MSLTTIPAPIRDSRQRLAAHLSLFRVDHSVKQIFVIPGIVIAASLTGQTASFELFYRIVVGLLAISAVASSNYVLNELLDAPFDRQHPTKCLRPAALGIVSIPLVYAQWLLCGLLGFLLAWQVSKPLFYCGLGLWVMGCLYNVAPIRMKDIAYLDVLAESVNNPIRLLAGWYIVTTTVIPPVSLLIAYWMLGGYFMALKRFSEYRQIGSGAAILYRRSFVFYTERALLTTVLFYASTAMLFFGAFIMRYRMEMVLAFPMIATLMAVYFDLAFSQDSPVQNPEKLYREPRVMGLVAACSIALVATSFVHLPWLAQLFAKSSVR